MGVVSRSLRQKKKGPNKNNDAPRTVKPHKRQPRDNSGAVNR